MINLLGNLAGGTFSLKPQAVPPPTPQQTTNQKGLANLTGSGVYAGSAYGAPQPDLSKLTMGQTATSPSAKPPSTTLPKSKANPVTSTYVSANTPTASSASTVTSHGQSNPFQVPVTPAMTALGQSSGQSSGQAPTFSGLLTQAVNQQGSPYNQQAQQNITQTSQYGAGNIDIARKAQDIADNYGKQIANVGQQGAAFESGQRTTGTSPVAEGNAAVTAQNTSAQQQALATGENAALQGIGYQLTGQNQAANAANAAAGQSLTGQGQTYGALQNAYSAVKPSVENYGQTSYNPVTNSFGTSGSNQVQPNDPLYPALQSYASMAANGQYSAIPSSITGNPALSAQLNSMAQQLNPNYSPITSQAQGAGQAAVAQAPYNAQASNINTAGTAETNALAQVYGQNAPAAYSLNTALNNIQSLGSITLQTAAGNNINPLSTQVGNQTIAKFKNGLGSASQAQFNSNLAAFASSLSALYSDQSGATPTQVSTWANDIVNGSMPMQQLQAIYSAAQAEGNARLSNLKNTTGAAYTGLQGTTGGGSTGNTGTVQTKAGAVNTSW